MSQLSALELAQPFNEKYITSEIFIFIWPYLLIILAARIKPYLTTMHICQGTSYCELKALFLVRKQA